ncbi:LysM repeat protein [Deinococcus metalli]|uniref:LysM repeat protein n=1 Tax=Deinococcus metalli TaxID=1141878 RepID=A0A7W8KCN1_9DEIO|nr:LysM peptidoglycan-binding domain-containing protein [Deinococcus metalli]MBB5374603.1 LysM repeat protein [Deinococcus metalli]GHF35092.1 hypothetical protein GCM10017781_09940 [Deinococcus metalli]
MLRRLFLLSLTLAAIIGPGVSLAATPALRTVTVKAGDTLPRIAARTGVSVTRLRALNGLRGDGLIRGQVLHLGPVSGTKPAAPQGVYTVRKGDWLSKVAARYGVTVAALRTANRLKTTVITPGQKLIVPARTRPSVTQAHRPAARPTTEVRTLYTYVRMGVRDTPAALAARYHLSVDGLRRLNGLASYKHMVPGSKLLVPTRVPVPIPPRPLHQPVTFKTLRPLGVPVQIITVDLRYRSTLIAPVLPSNRLNFGSGARVGQLARNSGAQALINGSYFHPLSFAPAGDIVMQGRMLTWGRIPMALAITPDNRATIRASTTPLLRRPLDTSWAGMETVIATGPRLLAGGRLTVGYSAAFRDPALFGRAARSAVGLVSNRDLVLVSTHTRLTTTEMGKLMARLGIRDALLLDGGSSAGIAWNGAPVLESVRRVSYGIGVFTGYTGRRYVR